MHIAPAQVTEVKVDRSFVRGISQSAAKRLIVESVIKLGRELGINVVAEGVETEAECLILQQMGCPQGQGYLFSGPVSAESFNVLADDGVIAWVTASERSGLLCRTNLR